MADFGAFMQGFTSTLQAKKDREAKRQEMELQKQLLGAKIKQDDIETQIKQQEQDWLIKAVQAMQGGGGQQAPMTTPAPQQPQATPVNWTPPMQLPDQQPQAQLEQPQIQKDAGIPDIASNMLLRGTIKKRLGIDPGEITYRSGMTSPTTGQPATLGLDPTGKVIREFPDFGAKKEQEKTTFSQEKELREQHSKLAGTYRDVRDAYSRIVTAAQGPPGSGDLALIFNFMKMLDPGSTVREGEFANAQNAAGVPDIVRAQWNRLKSGGRLADDTRTDFLTTAEDLYNTADTQYQQDTSETKRLAQSYGLNPERVVQDFGLKKPPKLGGKKGDTRKPLSSFQR